MTRHGSAWCFLGALTVGVVCQLAMRSEHVPIREHVRASGVFESACGIDPLDATPGELLFLPGIGPGLAQSIHHGVRSRGIKSIADLEQLNGIGPARIEAIRNSVGLTDQ